MIGSLEAEVVLALREVGEGAARDVREQLAVTGVQVAYTTVATILTRLHEKGIVRRRREKCQGGERYVYRPVDFERRYLRNLLRGVVTMFGPSGVVHLNEELAKFQPAEARELRRRLKI
jgi:predicted transcriptional regulator